MFLLDLFGVDVVIRDGFVELLIGEGVEEDGEEEVEEHEVAEEDPADVEEGGDRPGDVAAERVVEQLVPALHGEHLESCQEGTIEGVEVVTWDTWWSIVVLFKAQVPSEYLHP